MQFRFPMLLAVGLVLSGTFAHAAFSPVITEFLAANRSGLQDEDGVTSDWIEIQNTGADAGNLQGWFLTNDPDNLNQWTFPSTPLAPGAYLIVFATGKDRAVAGQPLHTSFALSAEGDYLALVQPDGATKATELTPSYPPQSEDVSFGVGASTTALTGRTTPLTYKIPTGADLPPHFNVHLWPAPNDEDTIFRSKAVGEPPFMLAISVWEAMRNAVAAAREGATADARAPVRMDAPATPERVLRALGTVPLSDAGPVVVPAPT